MRRCSLLACLWMLLWSPLLWAQGVLIVIDPAHPAPLPRPVMRTAPAEISYRIRELAVQARVADQVAQVQVTQSFVNTGSRAMEARFVFPLPYDGAIDRLTFMVDGKEYDAKLLPAAEARTIYEGYVRRNQDPALLEWVGQGMFQTSVFPIPPGAERKVIIKFSQLLRKHHQLVDLLYPLATARYTSQPVEKLSLQVNLEAASEIRNVYSPTHGIEIKRPTGKQAIVSHEATNVVPATDFRLFYDTAADSLAASLLSYRPAGGDEGYFLLLASPEVKAADVARPAKTVIFVLDRSGSMQGKKIEQAREAARHVLNNLNAGDTFNIVAYDSNVESFRPELQKYDDETRKAALGYVDGLYAGGSTNIDGALTTALGMIRDHSRPNFILFLTDGLPTHGETAEAKIAAAAKSRNTHRARLVTFGVGYDVNSRLLDRLARDNFGESEYVRPNENIETHVSRLYGRMSSPVLSDVKITFDLEGAAGVSGTVVNRIYPKEVYDLFAGEQLVLSGRYKTGGAAKITIAGQIGSDAKKYDFPATFADRSDNASYAFVEKIWATRRIGEIIDQIDLQGKNQELVNELVQLSLKHGILTPYTSFLADDQAPARLANADGLRKAAGERLDRLSEAGGVSGVAQRAAKKEFQFAGSPAPASDPAGRPALPSPLAAGAARDIDSDRVTTSAAVKQVAQQAFYKRGSMWIAANASDVDPEKDQTQITKIKRFSDDYFALVKGNTPDENALLADQSSGESLLVRMQGKVFLID